MNHIRLLLLVGITVELVFLISAQQVLPEKKTQIEDKVEEISNTLARSERAENIETTTRSHILDNVFNIPIQTLRAVSELVQSIAGNLQSAGAGTYFRRNEKINRPEKKSVDAEDD